MVVGKRTHGKQKGKSIWGCYERSRGNGEDVVGRQPQHICLKISQECLTAYVDLEKSILEVTTPKCLLA